MSWRSKLRAIVADADPLLLYGGILALLYVAARMVGDIFFDVPFP